MRRHLPDPQSTVFQSKAVVLILLALTLGSTQPVAAGERVTLKKIQALLDELNLQHFRKPIILSEMSPEQLRNILKDGFSKPGVSGTYVFQVDDNDQISIFFRGGSKDHQRLKPQTYRNGRWEPWSASPIYDREQRIDLMIDVHLQPNYFSDTADTSAERREPFFLNGFKHDINPDHVLDTYLNDNPSQVPAVHDVQTLTEKLSALDKMYQAARKDYEELRGNIATHAALVGRDGLDRLVDKYAPFVNEMDQSLNELTATRVSLKEARQDAAKKIDDEEIRRLVLRDSEDDGISERAASHFLDLAAEAPTNSARSLHLRMEAARYVTSRSARAELINSIIRDAKNHFGITSLESAQTGILIWKALTRAPDWTDKRLSAELENAIECILRTTAIYEQNSLEPDRTADLYDVLADMLEQRAKYGSGLVRRKRYAWDMEQAAHYRNRASQLREVGHTASQ